MICKHKKIDFKTVKSSVFRLFLESPALFSRVMIELMSDKLIFVEIKNQYYKFQFLPVKKKYRHHGLIIRLFSLTHHVFFQTPPSVYPEKHLWPLMLWKVKVIISVVGASQQLTAHRLFTDWLMTADSRFILKGINSD